jgi:hypothetical protein
MNHPFSNRKKATIAIALIAIIAASTGIYLQNNPTTQAALINPHPGLVGWWNFNEGVGNTVGDSSGNGNNGTISGASWTTGQYGQALNFNGASSYASVPDSPSLRGMTELTIAVWWKATAWTPDYSGIVSKYATGTDRAYILGYPQSGTISFIIANGLAGYGATTVTAPSPTLGMFHRLVGVFKGSSFVKLYIDGVQVASTSTSVAAIPNTSISPLLIGQYASYYANGVADEVMIYNRALSASEIQADYQQNPNFTSTLLAKVPTGTTQVITTISWQGTASINATIVSPSQTYTESTQPVYQKTTYSTTDGITNMLNIKRVSVSINPPSSDQAWNITLTFDNPVAYQITVEVQK